MTYLLHRSSKLATTVAATFSVEYALQWPLFFPDSPLTRPFPTFDGRCVPYPSVRVLRDYLAWRQVDCHVNNLYNTTFWAMVQRGGQSGTEAELELKVCDCSFGKCGKQLTLGDKGTLAADKNEILFSRFGINHNNEPEVYKKGTTIYRDVSPDTSYTPLETSADSVLEKKRSSSPPPTEEPTSKSQADKERKKQQKAALTIYHGDIIRDDFWTERPWILAERNPRVRR